jgi:hypothetical protein
MPTTTRIHNFSAGPAVLPLPVLEEAQRHLISLPGVGMSVMEISHRSSTFEDLLNGAIEDIRALAGVPANYKILMLQGGASLQFSMVPMNLLHPGGVADYVDTGSWSDKAIKEAKKVGKVNIAATTKADSYTRIPEQSELGLTPGAAYAHITSNNTIEGTEWKTPPDTGDVPLVADTSSDIFPTELKYGSPRVLAFDEEDQDELRQYDATLLEEDRFWAAIRAAQYQQALHCYHSHKVNARNLEEGNLVLHRIQSTKGQNKLTLKWEGPYRVGRVTRPGAVYLETEDGTPVLNSWNIEHLRKYYL